jgi:uncharacterized protein YndB with AHSA1/START domain
MHSTIPAIVIRRTYDVPPERVFEAWTTPELAKQFLGPNDVNAPEVSMDVRVGGSYHIIMQMADGERWRVGGVYRDVQRPKRLQMTWRWQEDNPADEHETLLTLEFNPHEGGTELVLTHEQLASEESRAGHERGWEAITEQLRGVLSK